MIAVQLLCVVAAQSGVWCFGACTYKAGMSYGKSLVVKPHVQFQELSTLVFKCREWLLLFTQRQLCLQMHRCISFRCCADDTTVQQKQIVVQYSEQHRTSSSPQLRLYRHTCARHRSCNGDTVKKHRQNTGPIQRLECSSQAADETW